MHHASATRIARLIYNAAQRRFEAVVEFFTPGIAQPLRVPVRVEASPNIPHRQLARALTREAQRRGIGGL
ncbi:hypothetical protein AXZ77_0278 [Thioclava sp. ES.031]|uniref:hypothetical protein n=1 Tax=Thioclava sp. ES.031 TaxID=1798203 RepID=UPI000BF747FA|nr:hypothetical protein [Thioclava sp. ES.031]PFG61729.1 hypothetical protein AXZ77_0278 [Thioclava sp. ES.031]